MGQVMTGRKRLTSSLIAVVAVAAAGAWWSGQDVAQAQREEPLVNCTPYEVRNLRNVRRTAVDLRASSTVEFMTQEIASFNRANGDVARITRALGSCEENLRSNNGRTFHPAAYSCAADASLLLAEVGPQEQRESHLIRAYCHSETARALATKHDQTNNPALAHAQDGRADALIGLASLSSGTQIAARRRAEAVNAYSGAVSAAPNAERYRRLSLGQLGERQFAPARANIVNAFNARGDNSIPAGPALAIALVTVGTAQGVENPDELLTFATTAAPNSVSANAARGTVYFNAGRFNEARSAFAAADARTAINDSDTAAGGRNYLADARYYLGVLEVQDGKAFNPPRVNWTAAFNYAESAVRAGGGDLRVRRLACLTHIGQGWERTAPESGRCEVENTPEGELMRGMYYLRRAQHYSGPALVRDTRAREDHAREMRRASLAFERGLAAAENMNEQQRRLEWPGFTEDVRAMLYYGRWVLANECSPGTIPVQTVERDFPGLRERGWQFFGFYNARSCQA